jgi:hypothetical protein
LSLTDRRIDGGKAAGDNGRGLLSLAVERPHGDGKRRRLRVKPVRDKARARNDTKHARQQDGANPNRQCGVKGFHGHPAWNRSISRETASDIGIA